MLEPDEDFMLVEDETFCERIVVSIIKPPSEQLGIKVILLALRIQRIKK